MPRQEAGAVAAKAKSGFAWRCDPQEVELIQDAMHKRPSDQGEGR